MILISACLTGRNCCWNGGNNLKKELRDLVEESKAISICPDELGGLPTPREPAEIIGGSGEDVLKGEARIINKKGLDITDNYLKGARETLKIAKDLKIKEAILKARSPSCGFGEIYDGTFSGRLKKGNGVTAALLFKEGIRIFTDESCYTLLCCNRAKKRCVTG